MRTYIIQGPRRCDSTLNRQFRKLTTNSNKSNNSSDDSNNRNNSNNGNYSNNGNNRKNDHNPFDSTLLPWMVSVLRFSHQTHGRSNQRMERPPNAVYSTCSTPQTYHGTPCPETLNPEPFDGGHMGSADPMLKSPKAQTPKPPKTPKRVLILPPNSQLRPPNPTSCTLPQPQSSNSQIYTPQTPTSTPKRLSLPQAFCRGTALLEALRRHFFALLRVAEALVHRPKVLEQSARFRVSGPMKSCEMYY